MPNTNYNTHAKEVPYQGLTITILCCVLQMIFGIKMFAEICRRSKPLLAMLLPEVSNRTHQKVSKVFLKIVKKCFFFLVILQIKTFITFINFLSYLLLPWGNFREGIFPG